MFPKSLSQTKNKECSEAESFHTKSLGFIKHLRSHVRGTLFPNKHKNTKTIVTSNFSDFFFALSFLRSLDYDNISRIIIKVIISCGCGKFLAAKSSD